MIVPARKMEMTRIAGERRGDAPGVSFWRGPGERLARRQDDGSAAVVPWERLAGLEDMSRPCLPAAIPQAGETR